jgi:hypothetical protein
MPLNPTTPCYGKTITGANAAIGCTTPTAATQALTFTGNAVAGETFTIGVNTYTWTSTAASISGQTPYFVLIGADAEHSIINAAAAITGTASKGTLFSNNTNANPVVTAVATSTTVLTITAIAPGADGNGIPVSETMTNASWGSTVTTGGASSALNVDISTGVGTQDVNLTKVGGAAIAIGPSTPAASLPTVSSGATNLNTPAQVTSTGTAATLVIARATRVGCLVKNTSTTGTVWIGAATVTSGTGTPLGPGDAYRFTFTGLVQVIDNGSAHCVVSIWDEYN